MPQEYAAGRRKLLVKIRRYQPKIVALLGITVCRRLFPVEWPERSARNPGEAHERLGLQPVTIHGARVFVLPNPSGRNAHYSYQQMLAVFQSLRDHTAM